MSNDRVTDILAEVERELRRAIRKHEPMNSPHEGWAVIREEVDELWDEVKADNGRELSAFEEAIQVAATSIRYVHDLTTASVNG